MADQERELTREALLALVKKIPCVRSVVVSGERDIPENTGWQESEEDYQKRQAEWLEEVARKKR